MIRGQWPGTVIDCFRSKLDYQMITFHVDDELVSFSFVLSQTRREREKQSRAHRRCLNGLIMNTFSSFFPYPINPINRRLFCRGRATDLIESNLCIGCFLSRRVFGTLNENFIDRWTRLVRGEFARLCLDGQRNRRIDQSVVNVRGSRCTSELSPAIDGESLWIDVIDGRSKNNIVQCIDNCEVKFQDGWLERTTSKP